MTDTVVIALVALSGVILTAFVTWLAAARSKYVETISAQRIKWVSELRTDFSEFASELTRMRKAFKRGEVDKRDDLFDTAYRRLVLIHLKLNSRSPLDREILHCMYTAISNVKSGDAKVVQPANFELIERVADLLKEEWEAAKWESAGPLRRIPLWWKRLGRWDEHQRRWRVQAPPSSGVIKNEVSSLSEDTTSPTDTTTPPAN